jgi:xylulose-5-phosphate/fructose-6-phosphate phosphoketolase
MEMLSEHQWKDGSRGICSPAGTGFLIVMKPLFICDSMFNQHAKWLKVTSEISWRRKLAH